MRKHVAVPRFRRVAIVAVAGGAIIGGLLGGGCAGRVPEPRQPTMVRSFRGTLVPGYYVSPNAYEHYVRAQLYANDGRADEAAEELRRAIASDAASAYLRTRLAEELLTLGRLDEAREEVEAAIHLDPLLAEAHVDLGRVRARLGDGAGAEAALNRAIEIDRGCEDAYLALVMLHRERGQEGRALEAWRALAQAVPTSAPAHHALGRAAAARGDGATAITELNRALDLDGSLQDAREELAEVYQADGRTGEAVAALEEAWERSGDGRLMEKLVRLEAGSGRVDDARARVDRLEDEGGGLDRRLWLGWRRLDARQPDRALALARDALHGGEWPGAHLLAARALEELGQAEEALVHLGKIAPRTQQYVAAQSAMTRLLREAGRYREAADQLVKALAAVGGDATGAGAADTLHDLLAQVHERAGNHEQAVHELERAHAARPLSDELTFALAAAYERAGQWQRALDTARAVIRREPESVQALNYVGYVMTEHSAKLDEARRLLERAFALRPGSGEVADSLGWLYVKLERLDDAERLLVRADRLTPEDPEILRHLGELYVKRGDRAHAVDAFRRALAHKPDERQRHAIEERLLLIESGRLAVGSGAR